MKPLNLAPYAFTRPKPQPGEMPWHMDAEHIQMLYALAMEPGVKSVMEIGSHKGASTAAFVEALNSGADFTLHLVEPNPTEELHRVIGKCSKPERIVLHECMSHEVTLPCDLVFIDGCHDWPALADVGRALALKTPTIAMHDTQSYVHGLSDCWGSFEGARILRQALGRSWTEDAKERKGKFTWRGFGVSREGE